MEKKGFFQKFMLLILAIAITFFVSFFGSIFTNVAIDTWYLALIKPSWTPPQIVFPIVWAVLYALIALALWLVMISSAPGKGRAYFAFAVQIFFNFTWSFAFFYLQSPLLGLINIIVLWFAILWNILAFHRCSRWAGYFLIPYFLWVSYATSLNIAIWMLN